MRQFCKILFNLVVMIEKVDRKWFNGEMPVVNWRNSFHLTWLLWSIVRLLGERCLFYRICWTCIFCLRCAYHECFHRFTARRRHGRIVRHVWLDASVSAPGWIPAAFTQRLIWWLMQQQNISHLILFINCGEAASYLLIVERQRIVLDRIIKNFIITH